MTTAAVTSTAVTTTAVTTTVRSTRDGVDRLYVRGPGGRRIGWYDLRTGATQVVDPDPGAAAAVQAAVDAYVAVASPLRRRQPLAAVPAPRPAPLEGRGHPQDREHRTDRTDRTGEPDLGGDDLRDGYPGEHVTRLLVARAVERAPVPTGRARWLSRDPIGPALLHDHQAALGQQQVGAVLARLPRPWHVMHCVPTSDRSCLDHLLVGPGGVVVLRTAAYPDGALRVGGDRVLVDGRPVSHVRLLRRQVAVVSDRLHGVGAPARVRGAVVAVGIRSVRTGDLPPGVSVVRLGDLARWVGDLPTVMSQVDVERLAATAAHPGTWPARADVPPGWRPRQQQRDRDRVALLRLTARAREAARWRRARRVVTVGAIGLLGAVLLPLPRPELAGVVLTWLAGG